MLLRIPKSIPVVYVNRYLFRIRTQVYMIMNYFTIVYLYLTVCTLVSGKKSVGFELKDVGFTCEKVKCTFPDLMQNAILHFVVGTGHMSYFPLLVNRVCEAHQKCMLAENMKIVLHTVSNTTKEGVEYQKGASFLQSLNIPYETWVGTFTADKKMFQSFKTLAPHQSPETFIYQTDVDEIPGDVSLKRALEELANGECDAIKARWIDRLAADGSLAPVTFDGGKSMQEQFPLRCRISPQFVGSRTEKILVYNSKFRVDG